MIDPVPIIKDAYRQGFHDAIWAIESMRKNAGGYKKAIVIAKTIHPKPNILGEK